MTDLTDQHTVTQPTPYQNAVPPSDTRTRRFVLPTVAVLLILGLAVFGAMQYRTTVQVGHQRDTAQASLATTRTDLKESESDLKDSKSAQSLAEDDRDTAQSNLSDAQATLDVCADVATSANHLHDAVEELIDAVSSAGDQDYVSSTGSLNRTTSDLNRANRLIAANGFNTVAELAAACSGGPSDGSTT